MPRVRNISDWLQHIEEADVPPWVRRVLRAYAVKHRGNRLMSRPLADVMTELMMSKGAVMKALRIAKRAGLIVVVHRGIEGQTAVYQGTFGTAEAMGELGEPVGVQKPKLREVHPNDRSESPGAPHYYAFDAERPATMRRRQLLDSTFELAVQERELVSHFSLLGRDGPTSGTCRGCGGSLDRRSAEVGFTVGDCCAVVVNVEHGAARHVEEGTA